MARKVQADPGWDATVVNSSESKGTIHTVDGPPATGAEWATLAGEPLAPGESRDHVYAWKVDCQATDTKGQTYAPDIWWAGSANRYVVTAPC